MPGARCSVQAGLVAFALALCAPAPADAKTSRSQAAKKALAALGVARGAAPVVVFGSRGPIAPRTRITQAGPGGAGASAAPRLPRRLHSAGVRLRRTGAVMRLGSEPAWLFHEDRGPHQAFEHPGRIALVGLVSGRVRTSRPMRWLPLVGGRPPPWL